MKGLLHNELLKIRAQSGFKVVMIIVLVIALLMPLAVAGIEALEERSFTDYGTAEYYEEVAERIENPIEKASLLANAEVERLFEDSGAASDWRYGNYYSVYSELVRMEAGYRLIVVNGEDPSDVNNYLWVANGFSYEQVEIPSWEYDENWNAIPPSAEEMEAYYKQLSALKESLKKLIETKDATAFYNARKSACGGSITELTETIALLKQQKPTDTVSKQTLEYELTKAEIQLEWKQRLSENYDMLLRKNADPGDWHYTVAVTLLNNIYGDLEESVDPGKEQYFAEQTPFESNEYFYGSESDYIKMVEESYNELLANHEQSRKTANDALELLNYSLRKDAAPIGTVDEGATNLESFTSVTASLVTVFLVVAAALVVANEYSAGTIRLLLIRPRSRRKILASKYWAVLIYGGAMALIAFVWQFICCAIFFGSKELLSVAPMKLFGTVIGMPVAVTMILYMILCFLGAWALMSFAFMLAVATRKAALSIVLPLLLQSILKTVTTITFVLIEALPKSQGVLAFTPLPYLTPSALNLDALRYYVASEGYGMDIGDFLLGIDTNVLCYRFSALAGAVWMAAFIALFTFIAFRVFRKQEIKS